MKRKNIPPRKKLNHEAQKEEIEMKEKKKEGIKKEKSPKRTILKKKTIKYRKERRNTL